MIDTHFTFGGGAFSIPATALAGQTIQIRLPAAPITNAATGAVVGNSGTAWEDRVVLPVGSCRPDPLLHGEDAVADFGPHTVTVCPECIDSWACDWQIRLVIDLDGSGE